MSETGFENSDGGNGCPLPESTRAILSSAAMDAAISIGAYSTLGSVGAAAVLGMRAARNMLENGIPLGPLKLPPGSGSETQSESGVLQSVLTNPSPRDSGSPSDNSTPAPRSGVEAALGQAFSNMVNAATSNPEVTGAVVGVGVSLAGAEALRRGAVAVGVGLTIGSGAIGSAVAEIAGRAAGDQAVAAGVAGGIAAGLAGAADAMKPNDPVVDTIKKVGQDIIETPHDVLKHIKENPLTSIAEGAVSPSLIILDAKLRKWFGK